MPLWDIAGKVLGRAVYELLGGAGPKKVPVYDGSIYFSDLLEQYSTSWRDRFREEIDMGLAAGHRAFKVKIGRGAKWMPSAEGYARDVEVLRVIRKHAGAKILIGVDANNGYDPASTRKLLAEVGDLNLAFVEEMFPEDVEQYLSLKDFLQAHGLETLIADVRIRGDPDRGGVVQAEGPEGRAAQLGVAGGILYAVARGQSNYELLQSRARSAFQSRAHRRRLQDPGRLRPRTGCAGIRPENQREEVRLRCPDKIRPKGLSAHGPHTAHLPA